MMEALTSPVLLLFQQYVEQVQNFCRCFSYLFLFFSFFLLVFSNTIYKVHFLTFSGFVKYETFAQQKFSHQMLKIVFLLFTSCTI